MDWVVTLQEEARSGALIAADEFAAKYRLSTPTLRKALRRLELRGLVERVTHKLYINRLNASFSPTDLVHVLRPHSYVSLDSALEDWGISTQGTYVLTCVTTGKPRDYVTRTCKIAYSSIAAHLFFGYRKKYTRHGWYHIAEPEKALLDWVYFYRQAGVEPSLDEMDFRQVSRSKLLASGGKFPSTVLRELRPYLATAKFAA